MTKFQKIARQIFYKQFLIHETQKNKTRKRMTIMVTPKTVPNMMRLSVLLKITFALSYPASIVESLSFVDGSKVSSL